MANSIHQVTSTRPSTDAERQTQWRQYEPVSRCLCGSVWREEKWKQRAVSSPLIPCPFCVRHLGRFFFSQYPFPRLIIQTADWNHALNSIRKDFYIECRTRMASELWYILGAIRWNVGGTSPGYSRISGFSFLSESDKNGIETDFCVIFHQF